MDDLNLFERGREAFARGAWAEAFERLMQADRQAALEPDVLDLAGTAAYLTGRHDESVALWTRAHHGFLERAETHRAVRAAFWLQPFSARGASPRRRLDGAGATAPR